MQPRFDVNITALSRYLSGIASSEECTEIEHWIEGDPVRKTWLEALVPSVTLPAPPELNVDTLDTKIQAAIRAQFGADDSHRGDRVIDVSQPQSQRKSLYSGSKLSVAFAAMLIVFGWFGLNNKRQNQPESVAVSSHLSTYTTEKGQRSRITLPDGSTVYLNVASRLEVPVDYSAGNRTITLIGSALFTVIPNSAAPFTVIAGPSITRVLGTRFVVRHYPTDTAAVVAVQDGKVSVGSSVLAASQQATVNSIGLASVGVANANAFSFTRGVLALSDVPIRDAIMELNRWYNAEIHIGDSQLDTREVTGEFSTGSVTDLAEILEWTYKLRVVRNGRILTLYPQ